ncbi:MAG: tRNA (adenosine(37)-N6)-dimethylallyltransferase MiaA [Lachnospiraceae bacterium]|nr:tRNA (adenosine(37)-N6)-dimethylallyltransferase MiaA [Lachnospiraceae bacterium]
MSAEKNKSPLIIIAGPTATGKSAAAVKVAKEIGGEVISADSMQVYRGMDIGSAKITEEEMQGVPHHLIDVLDPTEDFNVTIFQKMAKEAMRGIYDRGHIPIICGGTGFYIQSVLYDIDFTTEDTDFAYRHSLEKLAEEKGTAVLYEMLKEVDPASCESIHENNVKRVIRALEYYHETGQPISAHNAEQRDKEEAYDTMFFVITDERAEMYERIDRRVEQMMAAGLVEEVQRLKDMGIPRTAVSMQGLGYKEIYDCLNGECTTEEAVYTIQRDTRHFAKRQLTWFKREPSVIWIDRSVYTDTAGRMLVLIYEKWGDRAKNVAVV